VFLACQVFSSVTDFKLFFICNILHWIKILFLFDEFN
jgi:hypothetical protein